jgi:arylsulfatase A-like enzyme
MPLADQSFGALLEDMRQSGLLDEVMVVWMGEFGRTPRRGFNFSNAGNDATGRDHWCNCYSVAFAGGGVKGGNVVGSSDFIGGYPKERPVHISDLAATIFDALGVDPRASVVDIQGQPHQICDGSPVRELFM